MHLKWWDEELIMQEIGYGSWSCRLLRVMCKVLDILGALGRDRLRVMVEVREKGWVMWWFRRLRGSARWLK